MDKSMSFRIHKCLSTNELLSQVMRWDVLMGHFPLLRPQVSSSVGLLLVPERAPHQFSPVASIPGASCEEGRISGLAPPKPKSRPAPQTAPPPASTSKVMTSTRGSFSCCCSLPHAPRPNDWEVLSVLPSLQVRAPSLLSVPVTTCYLSGQSRHRLSPSSATCVVSVLLSSPLFPSTHGRVHPHAGAMLLNQKSGHVSSCLKSCSSSYLTWSESPSSYSGLRGPMCSGPLCLYLLSHLLLPSVLQP